jgi:UDP-N-acetylglucosamine 2-epimerase
VTVKPKVIHIVGARPQFIKYAAIYRIIVREHLMESFDNILLHTGQHYDYSMSRVFFDELGIEEPNYHLGVGSGSHGEQTAKIIMGVENILIREKPDLVVVYGDTNSTLGGALAASKLHIPVAHVEAGLRSYNKKMPEEINRVLTDHVSTILLCPTKVATQNLIREGFTNLINNGDLIDVKLIDSLNFDHSNPVVINVGDVMYDLFIRTNSKIQVNSKILKELNLRQKNYWLVTLHRAENTEDEKLLRICEYINNIVGDDIAIFPMHPRTKKVYQKLNIKLNKNVKVIEPLSYHDLLTLLVNSRAVITDSGGIQKEAYWARIPCITLRDETEWVETVESGWNVLYKGYHNNKNFFDINRDHPSFHGDGNASERIVKLILKFINNKGF